MYGDHFHPLQFMPLVQRAPSAGPSSLLSISSGYDPEDARLPSFKTGQNTGKTGVLTRIWIRLQAPLQYC